jgi:PleD family two-component response regulator
LLHRLLDLHGAFPVVVVDVDEFRRHVAGVGATVSAGSIERLRGVVATCLGLADDLIHFEPADGFIVPLVQCGYEEAVTLAERIVDAVRDVRIPFGEGEQFVTVTAVVTKIESSTDRERFELRVRDLLIEGKMTGGDVVVRDRSPAS